jgi:hypothetical protein
MQPLLPRCGPLSLPGQAGNTAPIPTYPVKLSVHDFGAKGDGQTGGV